jgi:hypothetical protein
MLLTPLVCPSTSLLRIPTQSKGPARDRARAVSAEGRVTRPAATARRPLTTSAR